MQLLIKKNRSRNDSKYARGNDYKSELPMLLPDRKNKLTESLSDMGKQHSKKITETNNNH